MIYFTIFICMCVHEHTPCVCHCPWKPEVGSSKAGVTEPVIDARNQAQVLWHSRKCS